LCLALSVKLLKMTEPAAKASELVQQGFARGANRFNVFVPNRHITFS
jgi:hypothetical protein